ncbi:MAG: hypothetical protein Q8P81_04475 [Nanoarchaeota archaeon]|nr:hypothetical protein [Nanoarchaeota archaeon]
MSIKKTLATLATSAVLASGCAGTRPSLGGLPISQLSVKDVEKYTMDEGAAGALGCAVASLKGNYSEFNRDSQGNPYHGPYPYPDKLRLFLIRADTDRDRHITFEEAMRIDSLVTKRDFRLVNYGD